MKKEKRTNNSIIKFLICATVFVISLSYVLNGVRNIFPLSYFNSPEYSIDVYDFLHSFYDLEIELPKYTISSDEIEVTSNEIIDFKINPTHWLENSLIQYNYDYYFYDYEDSETEVPTLTDKLNSLTNEEITELIRYNKQLTYQSIINEYKSYRYPQAGAFYYELTDNLGNTYTNLPEESVKTLNTVTIPHNPSAEFLNNYYYHEAYHQDNYNLTGKLYLPVTPMGSSTIQANIIQYVTNQIIWIICLILVFITYFLGKKHFKNLRFENKELPPYIQAFQSKYNELPIEVRILFFIFVFTAVLNMHFSFYYALSHPFNMIFDLTVKLVTIAFFILQLLEIYDYIKNPNRFMDEWQNGLYLTNIDELRNMPIYRNIFAKATLYTVIIGAWGILIGMSFMDFGLLIIVGAISIFVALFVLFQIKKRSKLAQNIVDTTNLMAQGYHTPDIKVKGHGIIADTAHNLNTIKEGVVISNKKQSQSERLKTELITNVSHDLRTPLTSILNYVDLAKRSDITDEERQEYLNILDSKSKRLKVLIDDLFEASKIASGAVELQKERIDLVSLMHQAIGEYEDRLSAANLTVRTKTAEPHMHATVDARKMFRVFENLLSNASKYSLPGTRVYVEMNYTESSQVEISIKNVSKYELGFDIIELSERFKRGDESRHTEGSGLGLSIVKSILDLHEAQLELKQDGDLFKVTFTLPKI
ncbi:MAG TPA: sensor histidine kinase [Firmicutes bacterium]|nr:sensor histidine kinase [Bacillota bacterium]